MISDPIRVAHAVAVALVVAQFHIQSVYRIEPLSRFLACPLSPFRKRFYPHF